MIVKLSKRLEKYATGRAIFTFFGLTLLFALLIVPTIQSKLEAGSGGVSLIDLQFSYTPEKAYSMIASYGDEGRALYRTFALTGDIIYPVVYSIFFSLIISWLFQRSFASSSKLQLLNIVPFGAWLFDWLENMNIVTMLTMYPSKSTTIATLASICTTIKWGFAAVGLLLLLIGLTMALKNGFKTQS